MRAGDHGVQEQTSSIVGVDRNRTLGLKAFQIQAILLEPQKIGPSGLPKEKKRCTNEKLAVEV
jgi:hypothetical protein